MMHDVVKLALCGCVFGSPFNDCFAADSTVFQIAIKGKQCEHSGIVFVGVCACV